MTDKIPGNSPRNSSQDESSRPIWLQSLIGLTLGIGVLGLMWYLFNHL